MIKIYPDKITPELFKETIELYLLSERCTEWSFVHLKEIKTSKDVLKIFKYNSGNSDEMQIGFYLKEGFLSFNCPTCLKHNRRIVELKMIETIIFNFNRFINRIEITKL